ncbi:putative secondary metabolism biosynthetic enzyme [Pestalotiopsis sp. IQ-011]
MLLRKLYENIGQKEKILLRKRFVQLDESENGVRVVTKDGSSYEGDILIGADGVHSAVRKEMHRLAHISSPGYFDKDEYAKDEYRLAEEHFGDRLNEHDTFADVYEGRIISRLTPLHEYQWRRWHFGRIMTIGDACHKQHPIGGSGGGAAVEDAAALVNALLRELRQSNQPLLTRDYIHVFSTAQRAQEDHTRALIKNGTDLQKFDAMESAIAPLIVKFVVPNLTDDAALATIGVNAAQGQRIESLPMPRRDRYIPYDDEKPAKPLNLLFTIGTFFVFVQLLLFCLAYFPISTSKHWFKALGSGALEPYIEDVVKYFTPTSGRPAEAQSTSPVSVMPFMPVLLIWALEGHRRGNLGSPWSWPFTFLFTAAISYLEPAIVLPIYFLLAIPNSARATYASIPGRTVPTWVASAMIPVTCVVYAARLMYAFAALGGEQRSESIPMGLWRFLPLCIPAALKIVSIIAPAGSASRHEPGIKDYMVVYLNKDYPPLSAWYRVMLLLSVLEHIFISRGLYPQQVLVTTSIVAHCLQSAFQLRSLGYVRTEQALAAVLMILLGTDMLGPMATYTGLWYWREKVIYGLSK